MANKNKDESGTRRIGSEKEAAEYMGVSVSLLQRDRWRKGSIPFLRIAGAVRYDFDYLDRYMDAGGNVAEVKTCA